MTISDDDLMRAQAHARAAARAKHPLTDCPYSTTDPTTRALAARWVAAYLEVRPEAIPVDETTIQVAHVDGRVIVRRSS